ncbi:MAG: hypothetical protein WBE26_04925, partial [Phycisphaerae bacterium]
VPVRMDLTDANGEEREVLEAHLQPDHVYVMDRGYAKFALFKGILDVGSSFVCRVRKRSGHKGRGGPEQGETILIATDLLDVPP